MYLDDIIAVGDVCVLAAVLVLGRGEVVGWRGRHVGHLRKIERTDMSRQEKARLPTRAELRQPFLDMSVQGDPSPVGNPTNFYPPKHGFLKVKIWF